MRKTSTLTAVLILVLVFVLVPIAAALPSNATTSPQKTQGTFNPIGKEGAVISAVAKYGLSPSSDKFVGGDASYVELVVAYPTKKLSPEDLNKVIDSDKAPKDWIRLTIRVPAFKYENHMEFMCYRQFKVMHDRLKRLAQTIQILWMPNKDPRYTHVVRIKYDGSDAIKVYPSRLIIVKERTTVPGK